MTSAESPEGVIHRFASLLDTAGVPYMLTGSFASGFHGAPRATQDIDIVISPTLGSLNRSCAFKLDTLYVDRWVEQLGLREEWLKAKAIAGQL
jgi:hypothetical protein